MSLLRLLRWWFTRTPPRETFAFVVNISSKPRVRIAPDGWISHSGGRFPFSRWLIVETLHANGMRIVGPNAEHAGYWPDAFWRGDPEHWKWAIVAYRIIGVVRQ